MSRNSNLRDDLLKQNGIHAVDSAGIRDKILARDERRVHRMKWLAGICWAVFLLSFLLAALVEYGHRRGLPLLGISTEEVAALLPEYDWYVPMAIIITQGLFILAVVMTFSLHVRSRTLTMHQIQASLAGIEERLRDIAEREQPK
jgi:hypothetical protein